MNQLLRCIALSLLVINIPSYASSPASKEYVDQKAAVLQAEINSLNSGSTYTVGSLYPNSQNAEGVVIYLDGNGHGIAVALSDQVNPSASSGVSYASGTASYGTPAQYTVVFGGSDIAITAPNPGNSHAILNGGQCTSASNCAAYVATQYTGPSGTDPVGTWYLPAKNELYLISNLEDLISQGIISRPTNYTSLATNTSTGGTSCANNGGCFYWSSSEDKQSTSSAWTLYSSNTGNSSNNTLGFQFKTTTLGVRAVRGFTY